MHRESFHEVLSLSICSVIKQRMQKQKVQSEIKYHLPRIEYMIKDQKVAERVTKKDLVLKIEIMVLRL